MRTRLSGEKMLFDDRDLRVFDNADSRNYFKEILQSYYNQNYRATVVLLYSFVIYDLFMKLQNMSNEGDEKAAKKFKEINNMIADDEKYSKVENEVVQFFKDNCPLYFDRFVEDIDYLKNCRNKCAHLKFNDTSLFVPSDYQARMLICSMYDHILSVKAPFIMDLFAIAQTDVEEYSNSMSRIPHDGLDESIKKSITDKYLKRMTYDSVKKSYKTFIRLLFVSDSEDCTNNVNGLYAFAFSITDYIIKNGYTAMLNDDSILAIFSKINVDTLKDSRPRANAFISLLTSYPVIMDIVRDNEEVFGYISNRVLTQPVGLKYYKVFYPRSEKTTYEYFEGQSALHIPYYIETIYKVIKSCDTFNMEEYLRLMINAVPSFNGFSDADRYMDFLEEHLSEISIDTIKEILEVYNKNLQCTKRDRSSDDVAIIKKYIEENDTKKLS